MMAVSAIQIFQSFIENLQFIFISLTTLLSVVVIHQKRDQILTFLFDKAKCFQKCPNDTVVLILDV